jgi:FkbM family methyltransferase
MLNFLIARIIDLGRLKSLFSILPAYQALHLASLNLFRAKRTLGIRVNGQELLIRSSTPDIDVAKESLVYGEYDGIALENPQVILDLGANIGTSAIALSRQFPGARIYAVEMESNNFALMCENVRDFKNIVPVQAAIAATSGMREMFDRKTGPWGYTIADTHNEKTELGEKIEALSLDSLCERFEIRTIDLLKMDIEGAEKEVFEAGGRWLNITNAIVIELHDYIVMGASRAFYLATADFSRFARHGEKVLAYR